MLGSSRSNRINVLPGLLGRLDGTWRALNALRSTLPVDVASPAGRSGLVTVLSLCRSRANATPGTRPSSSTCAIPPGSEDYVVIDAARNPLQRDLPTTQFDGDGAYPHVISVAGCVFKYAPEASIVKTNPKGGLASNRQIRREGRRPRRARSTSSGTPSAPSIPTSASGNPFVSIRWLLRRARGVQPRWTTSAEQRLPLCCH
jgi:hypothetical protein